MAEIPKGKSREEIKIREKIIKDFYATWISEHQDKMVFNESIKDFIRIKYLSINETCERAARTYDSTMAVFKLTDILSKSKVIATSPIKANDKNQRPFSYVLIMRYENIRLIVGQQKSTGHFLQYCITVPSKWQKKTKVAW